MKFQDARNYKVSSNNFFYTYGFKAEIELKSGFEEVFTIISNKRIKDVNHIRYSNQNYLEKYGIN